MDGRTTAGLVLACLLSVGCGSSAAEPRGAGGAGGAQVDRVCVPGSLQLCGCEDSTGEQECLPDGSGHYACDCDLLGTGGIGGAGGNDLGTGGTAGNGGTAGDGGAGGEAGEGGSGGDPLPPPGDLIDGAVDIEYWFIGDNGWTEREPRPFCQYGCRIYQANDNVFIEGYDLELTWSVTLDTAFKTQDVGSAESHVIGANVQDHKLGFGWSRYKPSGLGTTERYNDAGQLKAEMQVGTFGGGQHEPAGVLKRRFRLDSAVFDYATLEDLDVVYCNDRRPNAPCRAW